MRWEDQELNQAVPENKFPEVFFAGLFLLGCASRQLGSFLHIDQQTLNQMIEDGDLPTKAKGAKIDRLCLYYRLSCHLGPGGDHYPVLGITHFWEDSKSLYAVLNISPKNEWLHIMVLGGEAPRPQGGGDGPPPSDSEANRASSAAGSRRAPDCSA